MSHVNNDDYNHSNEVTGLIEDSKEVKELQPHKESNYGNDHPLNRFIDFLIVLTLENDSLKKRVKSDNEDSEDRYKIDVIPERFEIFYAISTDLLDFID